MAISGKVGDSRNIFAGAPADLPVVGGVFRAPLGTPLPTSVDAVLDDAFIDLGYVSEDGVTETIDSSTNDIKAWGGDIVATLREDYSVSWQLSLLEYLNARALRAAHGDTNVAELPATVDKGNRIAVKHNSRLPESAVWVVDSYYAGKKVRKAGAIGKVTEQGDLKLVHSDLTLLELTVKFFPDADGNFIYTYTDDGVFASVVAP